MKVCLVSQEYPPETGWGGIGTQTYLKAQGLATRGHEVHVVSASWDNNPRSYRDNNVLIHRIPLGALGAPGYETSTYWLAYSTSVAKKLSNLNQAVGFDVIQFPEYAGEGFIYQSDTFEHRTASYVVQAHGPLTMLAEHISWPPKASCLYQIGRFMECTVIKHSDLLLASSRNTANFTAEEYGYPLDKIQVVYSAVDTEKFFPQTQSQDRDYPKVLFVGKVSESKGAGILVNAVLQLRLRYPKIKLRVVGKGDTNCLAMLQRRIEAERAVSNFEFKGYVPRDELPQQYAWCDFFVSPSVYEGGPGNVYLEAMACAKPVVACNSGGTPEVVRDRETGLLVPPRDTRALAGAIAELTENVRLRERLSEACYDWVQERFSFKKYVDRVENLYNELVQ